MMFSNGCVNSFAYTDKDLKENENDLCKVMTILHQLEGVIGNLHYNNEKKEYYPNISWSYHHFTRVMHCAKKVLGRLYPERAALDSDNPFTFLDVGCGIGTKMLLARQYGFKQYGIEINGEYAKIARLMNPSDDTRVMEVDALQYDQYHQFDCIYFYTPIKKHELYRELSVKIAKTAKMNAVIICAGLFYSRDVNHIHLVESNVNVKCEEPHVFR